MKGSKVMSDTQVLAIKQAIIGACSEWLHAPSGSNYLETIVDKYTAEIVKAVAK